MARIAAKGSRFVIAAWLVIGLVIGFAVGGSITIGRDDWRALSDVGQAFGTLSALLSAAALIGVVSSIRLQRQQSYVARLESVRNVRSQLVLFAFDRPKFLSMWGYDPGHGLEKAQETAYLSMVFSYMKMAFIIGVLTERELDLTTPAMFAQPQVSSFWEASREIFLRDTFSEESRRFARIVDAKYTEFVTSAHLRCAKEESPAEAGGA